MESARDGRIEALIKPSADIMSGLSLIRARKYTAALPLASTASATAAVIR